MNEMALPSGETWNPACSGFRKKSRSGICGVRSGPPEIVDIAGVLLVLRHHHPWAAGRSRVGVSTTKIPVPQDEMATQSNRKRLVRRGVEQFLGRDQA